MVGAMNLKTVDVPLTPRAVDLLLPAVEVALAGGPALAPLPTLPPAAWEAAGAALQPDQPIDHDDVAFIVPTSGSTGNPSGVLLSARAVTASATATHERLGGEGGWLHALPAHSIGGLMVLARSVVAGTRPVAIDITRGFNPADFANATRELRARHGGRTYTSLVARQLSAVLDAGGSAVEALATFDAVLVGGSSVGEHLLATARASGVNVVTTYGMTETCGGCVYDGVPLDGVQINVDTSGVVKLACPMLSSGYRLQPELTAERFQGGWFRTNDLGQISRDGRLTILGRQDDVAITGGVNVPLAAVDDLVAAAPGVREAVAVARPDDEWGQLIAVAIVAENPQDLPSLNIIREHVKQHAPAPYAPKEVVVIDAVPVTSSGKVDRRAVAAAIFGTN